MQGKVEWKDVSIYSKDELSYQTSAYSATQGRITIALVFNHLKNKKGWIMHCYDLQIIEYPLAGCMSLEEAKYAAIAKIERQLYMMLNDLEKFKD